MQMLNKVCFFGVNYLIINILSVLISYLQTPSDLLTTCKVLTYIFTLKNK